MAQRDRRSTKPAKQKERIQENLEPRASRLEEGTPRGKAKRKGGVSQGGGGKPAARPGKVKYRGDASRSSTGKKKMKKMKK